MDAPTASRKQLALLDRIVEFAESSSGLEVALENRNAVSKDRNAHSQAMSSTLILRQRLDGHAIEVPATRLSDILMRTDSDGRDFVQVNFEDGTKILITDRLIGFKPVVRDSRVPSPGHRAATSLSKLPKVVTTPDIISVLEAIEDAIDSEDCDLPMLRDLFEAIVRGAESVGFNVTREKSLMAPYLAAGTGFRANA